MDERLIQQQEQELAKTGRYYLHVCFMTIPLLCMACFLYGLRPLLLCGAALLTGNLCDRLVSLLRRRVYQGSDFSNESFALVIALLMPVTVDIYVLIAAVVAGVLIGKEIFGGNAAFTGTKVTVPAELAQAAAELSAQGKTPLFFGGACRLLGVIAVADTIKEDSPRAIRELQAMGIKVALWTVDTEKAVRSLLPLGPDCIVTNRPDRVREWVEENQ